MRALARRGSQRAGEGAAVDQQVLPGDVAGMGRAQEGAELAELGGRRRTGRPGRRPCRALDLARASRPRRCGIGGEVAGEPVGGEAAGQDVVDRHALAAPPARASAGDEAGEPGAGAVGEAELGDRRLDRGRGDVDDPAEAALRPCRRPPRGSARSASACWRAAPRARPPRPSRGSRRAAGRRHC